MESFAHLEHDVKVEVLHQAQHFGANDVALMDDFVDFFGSSKTSGLAREQWVKKKEPPFYLASCVISPCLPSAIAKWRTSCTPCA